MDSQKNDYVRKYSKWIDKRLAEKPAPMQKLIRRSYNSGLMVLSELDGIPFSKLSYSLYFLCQDMQTEQLSHKYESMLELAGANPDRFMASIHKELNNISRYIKQNSLLPEFFEFISSCDRLRCIRSTEDMDVWHIMTAYMDLLMQTCCYLSPSKFDFRKHVCGCSTTGEVLLCEEYYPNIDDIANEVTKKLQCFKGSQAIVYLDSCIAEIAARFGYSEISSYSSLTEVTLRDNNHTTQIGCMMTYINEYTYDMLPEIKHIFNQKLQWLESLHQENFNLDFITSKLKKRTKTLPSNGIFIKFSYTPDIYAAHEIAQHLVMKEILHDDRIVMLYKLRVSDQDMCGYYDIKDEFFHSLLQEVTGAEAIKPLHEKMRDLILYLYAAATSRDCEQMLLEFGNIFSLGNEDQNLPVTTIHVEPFYRGGKLRNTYLEDKPYNPTGPRIDNEKYEHTEQSIQGYIRKVGAGRTPSREAIARAEALGFSLAQDETYVQPFTKRVLRLKRK